ncbi:MAG: hypothetical protein IE916_00575 [Epsilonproteobacteria bacterium]|nr:hypothetical protein [Campylobacterota bacterium]
MSNNYAFLMVREALLREKNILIVAQNKQEEVLPLLHITSLLKKVSKLTSAITAYMPSLAEQLSIERSELEYMCSKADYIFSINNAKDMIGSILANSAHSSKAKHENLSIEDNELFVKDFLLGISSGVSSSSIPPHTNLLKNFDLNSLSVIRSNSLDPLWINSIVENTDTAKMQVDTITNILNESKDYYSKNIYQFLSGHTIPQEGEIEVIELNVPPFLGAEILKSISELGYVNPIMLTSLNLFGDNSLLALLENSDTTKRLSLLPKYKKGYNELVGCVAFNIKNSEDFRDDYISAWWQEKLGTGMITLSSLRNFTEYVRKSDINPALFAKIPIKVNAKIISSSRDSTTLLDENGLTLTLDIKNDIAVKVKPNKIYDLSLVYNQGFVLTDIFPTALESKTENGQKHKIEGIKI